MKEKLKKIINILSVLTAILLSISMIAMIVKDPTFSYSFFALGTLFFFVNIVHWLICCIRD